MLLWIFGAWVTIRGVVRQKRLPTIEGGRFKNANAPRVSILVPARNEAGRVLAASIKSMLAQDYGRFEVIVVDDRSTDDTAKILHELAKRDARLRVIDGAKLPEGWLGKPHTMQQAFQAATFANKDSRSWILATDADMIFDSRAVRTTVAHAEANNYDAVTLFPHVECVTFWERVFMPTFGWFMLIARPLEKVNDEKKSDAIGVGGFFLIRQSWLERLSGWAAVRAEVAEDLRLAETLKAAGARLRVEYAPQLIRTRMQTNLKEIWEGFTKNLFAGTRFSLAPAIFGGIAVLLFSVLPPVLSVVCLLLAVACGQNAAWDLFIPLACVWFVQFVAFAFPYRQLNLPLQYAALVPLGHLLFVLILFNSAFKIAFGTGVKWKGRVLYDRAGVRPPREV